MKNDLFSKIKTTNENQKNLIYLIGYGALILIALIYVNLAPNSGEKKENYKENTNEVVEINIKEELEQIKDNYSHKITIKDGISKYIVERDIQDQKEIGLITTEEEQTNYIYIDDYYIIKDETNIIKEEVNVFRDYDGTFAKAENILAILNKAKEEIDLEEEKYKIKRYKISLSEFVTTYNQINKTDYRTDYNDVIIVNINYNEKIESINMDLTTFYNNILNLQKNEIIYTIEFSNIGKVDLTGLENIINLVE